VKEQILIRYLGLGGGKKLITRGQKNKHQYTAAELLKQLCKVAIPLQDVKEVPNQPQDSFMLGTKSSILIQLDDEALAKEEHIRLNAMLERDQRENSGFVDQLMEMMQPSWAVNKIWKGLFKIDV
jgi:hypothetical protein